MPLSKQPILHQIECMSTWPVNEGGRGGLGVIDSFLFSPERASGALWLFTALTGVGGRAGAGGRPGRVGFLPIPSLFRANYHKHARPRINLGWKPGVWNLNPKSAQQARIIWFAPINLSST